MGDSSLVPTLLNGRPGWYCTRCRTRLHTADERPAHEHGTCAPWGPIGPIPSVEQDRAAIAHSDRERRRATWRESKQRARRRVFRPRPCANPECESPFVPDRAGQRFCQDACRNRAKYLRSACRC